MLAVDEDLLQSFEMKGKAPRSVMVIAVESVYFQCARALLRSQLWNLENHVDPASLPTAGQMLESTSNARIDAKIYDGDWAGRALKSLW